ncbi:MAG: DEAD/DEAH box helicase [Pseudomonadota bacterium]
MKRELHLVVMPDGSVQPEWAEATSYLTQSTELMQTQILERFLDGPDSWLLFLGFCDQKIPLPPALSFFRQLAALFTRKIIQTPDLEIIREKARVNLGDEELTEALAGVPMMTGAEYISADFLREMWERLSETFSDRIARHEGSVQSFIRAFSPDIHLVGRVFFHLVENTKGARPFAFLATYANRVGSQGRTKHLPLKHALTEYAADNEKLLALLSTVYTAAEKSHLISQLVQTGELFHPLSWSSADAFAFLKEVSLYEESGILCRIPDWWKGRAQGSRLSISFGEKKPAHVGMDAILSFDANLMIGDLHITVSEARALLEEAEGLAFIKNKWVAVDPEKLRQTLVAYEKAREMSEQEGVSVVDALRWQLGTGKIQKVVGPEVAVSISQGSWLESVADKLRHPELVPAKAPGKGFRAKLRPYQKSGLNWLCFLHSIGFGACLADDMGLGKTIQLLAFLSVIKAMPPKRASLLILPGSLIANWVHEIGRFLPDLVYTVAHPGFQSKKEKKGESDPKLDGTDLVITTYGLAQKYRWLIDTQWSYVILDEAQAIKNPGAKQTRAIKALKAENRIVMTGTPVENRLSDLWSLFDFVNPGLLGNVTEFGNFVKGLKDRPEGYKRLRTVVSPYILRRLKTDKSIISDLPDKVEMKTYAALSKKQVVLYQKMTRELIDLLDTAEGIQRRGLVLSSLMKFKQLCNHPDQYLGTGAFEETHSGKFSRLREICETIYEKRERVLIFTQFKEITQPLADFLETVFGRSGLIFHGGVPVAKRRALIDRFQEVSYVPFMVLSLKAGGVGLNLTRANHVIHFDRWWNPAVENQATDRAFRIGQEKKVVVHKFLTQGTIEEKIDGMLEEKKALADRIVSETGEAWITELDNEALKKLFTLTL